jgi:hypothetical protein
MMKKIISVSILSAIALTNPILAQAENLDMRYRISLAGLSLGTANMSGVVASNKYQLNIAAKLQGLVGLVLSGSGAAQGSGTIVGGKPSSNGYALTANNSSMTRTIQMSIANMSVGEVAVTPPFEEHPDRVPLSAATKKGVVDPIGALVMPTTGNPLDPAQCNRTLPVFDSFQRFNVVLSYVGTKDVSVRGYQGPVLVCAARYTPIAGHRPTRKQTVFMANNKDMSAWLMPVGDTGLLLPFRISVKTQIGTSVIEADAVNLVK